MPNYKLVVSLALLIQSVAGRAAHVPTVDELMQVTMPAGPVISPNGKWVVYSVTLPDLRRTPSLANSISCQPMEENHAS